MTVRGADYKRRALDNYPTPVEVTTALLNHVQLGPFIHDPACGRKQLILKAASTLHYICCGSDISQGIRAIKGVTRATGGIDFFYFTKFSPYDIVTNPPYGDRRGSTALRFIEHALAMTEPHRSRVAMLLPIDFDSGKTRLHVFKHPAFKLKLVLLDRIKWFNGQSGSTNHAWYVWDWKHKGPPIIKYARIDTEEK